MVLAVEIVPGGDAAIVFVFLTLFVLFFTHLLWATIMPPWHKREIVSTVMFMAIYWLGWTVRTWPSRSKGDGPIWSLLLAWRDSILSLIFVGFKLVGLEDVGRWLVDTAESFTNVIVDAAGKAVGS